MVPRPPPGLVCLTLLRPSSTTSPPNTGAQLTKTALDLSTTTNLGKYQPELTPFYFFSNFRYTLAGFAAVDARVILAGFDSDSNGILDANECAAWKEFVQGHMSQWGWNPTADQQAAMKAAWNNAQSKFIQTRLRKIFANRSIKPYLKIISDDGDASTANMVEIAKFLVGAWNVFLQ